MNHDMDMMIYVESEWNCRG